MTEELNHHQCGDLRSPIRNRTCVPCIGRQILNHWIAREVSAYSILKVSTIHPTPHPTPDLVFPFKSLGDQLE